MARASRLFTENCAKQQSGWHTYAQEGSLEEFSLLTGNLQKSSQYDRADCKNDPIGIERGL
jgi:hypothetical protein